MIKNGIINLGVLNDKKAKEWDKYLDEFWIRTIIRNIWYKNKNWIK